MKTPLTGLICLGFVFAGLAAPAGEPANPHANTQVRAILSYFHSLAGRKDKRVLSGQFTDFGNGANLKLIEDIHAQTGHWPALIGVDYADFGKGGLTFAAPNRTAIEYWRQGGLVTVSAHLYNPANPKGGGLRDKGVNLAELLAPDGDTHTRWMRELDQLAGGLQELKDAGVVVLWRPFHEMNGGWFWWGAQPPDTFIKVWRQMFDYFSNTRHLDNLIWVYGPNHGDKTASYYTGDHYVDLVGLDAYTDFVDRQHIKGFDAVAALGKPVGFSEFGPHGPQNPPGDFDYRRFLAGVEQDFSPVVFFMSWNGKWSLGMNPHAKEMLDDPRVVNREDLPANLFKP
jgi:mannan endo-1,4-beta-mannosidase